MRPTVIASDLDDLAPVIGYRATRIIATWFAGRDLHAPVRCSVNHPLERLVGRSAFEALVREFPGERFTIPTHAKDDACRRERRVAEAFAAGKSCAEIAEQEGVTKRCIELLRADLAESGLLVYAQGFDTAMARGSSRKASDPPTIPNFESGGVFGEPPPTSSPGADLAIAMGILSTP